MDIASLLDSLSEEDMKKLKDTAAQFFGSSEPASESGESMFSPFSSLNPKMLTSVAKFSSMMNERDPRSDFIMALKPLLSEDRRKKADEAAMVLKFLKIISALGAQR